MTHDRDMFGRRPDQLPSVSMLRREVEHAAAAALPPLVVAAEPERQLPQPVSANGRSKNQLRPATFDTIIGQAKAVSMMRRMVASAKRRGRMDHTLLVGAAGTGKTTFANVIANELGARCFQLSAPVSLDTLLDLAEAMRDGDVLFIDEIHMQAVQERRGKSASTEPEVFLQLLEDGVLATPTGMVSFPDITIIGATTDEGMLPDPFISRFPLRPQLERYNREDLGMIALHNALALGLKIEIDAADAFAKAARYTPREVNTYMKNAASLSEDGIVRMSLAKEVLHDLNGVTDDGLTRDMQNMLTFLYTRARRETKAGDVTYQASVNTIATAIGKSRDTKAIQLRVEPYLIDQGYVQVGHGGRVLTDAGVNRARLLVGE